LIPNIIPKFFDSVVVVVIVQYHLGNFRTGNLFL
jgi:hypothetical protein